MYHKDSSDLGKKILQSVSKQILFPNGDTSDLFYNDKSKFFK